MPDTDLKQLGVSLSQSLFADQKTPANPDLMDIGKQLSASLFPESQKPAASPNKDKAAPRGFFKEAASSLGAGFAATGESLSGSAEMVGIPGAEKAGKFFSDLQETDALKRPDYLKEGTVLDKPEYLADWRWWTRSLGENLPNMLTALIPAGAAVKGAQALNWGTKAIRAAGLSAGWSGSMALESGAAYSSAKKEMTAEGQLDASTIERIATMEGLVAGTANSLLEILPIDNLLFKQSGGDRLLKKILRQALWEGGTEVAQESVNVMVEKYGHKPDQELSANIGRLLEAGLIGAVLGGGAGATVGAVQNRQDKKNNVLRSMGMKPPSAKPDPAAAPMTTSAVDSKTAITEEDRAKTITETQAAENKAKGKSLFDAVATEDLAEQSELEAARKAEDIRRTAETAALAAKEQEQLTAAVSDAQSQHAALSTALSAGDIRKQAIVDEVLGLSERVLLSSLQKDLKLTVAPAGPGVYSIETPAGPQPANLLDLRQRLAEKRVADLEASDLKAKADREAVRQMEDASAAKKTEKQEAETLGFVRSFLAKGSTLSPEQRQYLDARREQLTPKEIEQLDQSQNKGVPPLPPTEFAPAGPISEVENPDKTPAAIPEEHPEAQAAMIDLMLSDLDNASEGGLKYDAATGMNKRQSTGVAWLSDAVKQGLKVDVKAARVALFKAKKKETLTPAQQEHFDALTKAADRRGYGRIARQMAWGEKGFSPANNQQISVDDLVEGDAVVIADEEFRVTDIDESGNVTLKDGTIRKVKDGTVLSGVEFVKLNETAPEFEFKVQGERIKDKGDGREAIGDEEQGRNPLPASAGFKMGDKVRPKKGSGIPKDYAGKIDHITAAGDIKTNNSGSHFSAQDWEIDIGENPPPAPASGGESAQTPAQSPAPVEIVEPEAYLQAEMKQTSKREPDMVDKDQMNALPESEEGNPLPQVNVPYMATVSNVLTEDTLQKLLSGEISPDDFEFPADISPHQLNAFWDDLYAAREKVEIQNKPIIEGLKKELESLSKKKDTASFTRKKEIKSKIDDLTGEYEIITDISEPAFQNAQEKLSQQIVKTARAEGLTETEEEIYDMISDFSDGRMHEQGDTWNKPLADQVLEYLKTTEKVKAELSQPEAQEPGQMTRAEYRASENKKQYDAIVAALQKGKSIEVRTQMRITPLTSPDHIRINKNGDVQTMEGKGRWVHITGQMLEGLAVQAGMKFPRFDERTPHADYVEQAVSEGKPVPENVLADYPDLKEQAPSTKLEDFGEKIGGARKDTAEHGYTMGGKITKEDDGQPAWRKQFIAIKKVDGTGWTLADAKAAKAGMITRSSGQVFSSQEEAEKAIPLFAVAQSHRVYESRDTKGQWSIYKKVGDRKLFKVVNQDFPSREDAMKHMAEHAEEILNIKTTFGEEILPVPEIAKRTGAERRTADATPEMFNETFAPRAIEFGNWNNQEERQQVLNHAYDGLLDLADALNVSPKALMLNGDLAIAFGARGQGLSGAKAHYEPNYGVINLTKMKGAGSLAHEWFHAFDHYLGRLDTKATSEKTTNKRGDLTYPHQADIHTFQSHGKSVRSKLRAELQTAYKSLMEGMYKKAEQYVEDTKVADRFLAAARENLVNELKEIRRGLEEDRTSWGGKWVKYGKPATTEQFAELDRLADILVEGGDLTTSFRYNNPEGANTPMKRPPGMSRATHGKLTAHRWTNDTLENINAIMKTVRNRQGFNSEGTGSLDHLRAAMNTYSARIKMLSEANNKTEKTKSVPTNYAIEAKKMDQARTSDYWSEPHEMAARAFAAYVEDKISAQGNQSDFLVYHAHGGIFLPMIDGFVARPYPEGKEREAINNAFDDFIGILQTRKTDKGVAMLSVEEANIQQESDAFAKQLDDYAAAKIRPRSVVTVGKTPYVLEQLGAEPLPLVITKETIDKVTADKHGLSLDTLKELPGHLADPIMVFDSATQQASLVVMTELKQDGKTVVAAIHLSREQGRNVVNDIASVHPRQSETHFINWINQGLLRYMNKKKSRAWSVTSGLQLPTVRGSIPGSDKKILFEYDIVKREEDRQYSTQPTNPPTQPQLSEPGLNDMVRGLAALLKGINVVERDGSLCIRTKSGDEVRIASAEYIDPDGVAITIEKHYSKEKMVGKRIAGMFEPNKKQITLVRDVAGIWTLSHEFYHFLEDIGAVSNADRALLNTKIASLIRKDPDTFGYLANRSLPEQRADYVGRTLVGMYDATTPTGKIMAKIREIIDRVVNAMGIRTGGGVVRDIETGGIYKAKGNPPPAPASGGQEGMLSVATTAEDVMARVTAVAEKRVSQAVNIALGRVSPEKREFWRKFTIYWNEFWKPFSTLPNSDQLMANRLRGMGNVGKAMRFVEALHTELDVYPDDIKKDMFRFLDGQIPIELLPEKIEIDIPKETGRISWAKRSVQGIIQNRDVKPPPSGETKTVNPREIAKSLQLRHHIIGEMMVERGLLMQQQFDARDGHYVHYMYAKHIVGDDAPVGITSSGKMNLSVTLSRNPNLTMQQRKELGLIDDASVAVPVGMGKALMDIAKFDNLKPIADNPDWVWQPSVVRVPIGKKLDKAIHGRTRSYVMMGIGKLVDEVTTYGEIMRTKPSPETSEIQQILIAALDKAQKETGKAPEGFAQAPNTRAYGPLAGMFVAKPILDDLMPVMDVMTDRGKFLNTIIDIEQKGMAAFKMGKVALNVPTMVRNVGSNVIQINLSGRNLVQIFRQNGDLHKGIQSFQAEDQYYAEARDMALFNTNWFATEIGEVLESLRKAESGRIDKVMIFIKDVAKFYGRIDDLFKLAMYRQQRESGKTIEQAALHAMKWGMDYSLSSRSVKGLRQTIMPFATYQYKIAPLIAESLKRRPWVLAKFALIYPAAKMLAMSLHDMDDDDWEDLQKQLPAYIKKSGSMMILPAKTDKGQWQWVNLEYFFPWGNALAIFRDARAMDSGEALRDLGISNPFLSMFYTGLSAREDSPPLHAYFGTPIYNALDPAPMKAAKYLEYMVNTWMPSMLTRQGAAGYTGKWIAGGEDRWGREVTLGQAAGRWLGLNIVSVSPEQSRAQASVKIQEMRKEMSRIEADPSRDDENKEAYRARLNAKLAEIAEESPASVLPITKAKGADPVYEALKDMAARGILRTGPPARTVELNGVPLKMTMEQYRDYLDRSSDIARRKLLPLVSSPAWDAMSDKRKTEVVSGIVSNARKGVRQKIKVDIRYAEKKLD